MTDGVGGHDDGAIGNTLDVGLVCVRREMEKRDRRSGCECS